MRSRLARACLVVSLLSLGMLLSACLFAHAEDDKFGHEFDGERAIQDVLHQVSLGPRTPGSPGHAEVRSWISGQLQAIGWQVEIQETAYQAKPVHNIIARRDQVESDAGWIVIGAHYDTRFWADQDPDPANRQSPVPGANDGASGVAVLLELARVLPADLPQDIWLVFFDAEDNGGIDGWDWIMGSRAFVESLETRPQAAVIVDMVGDADLNLFLERNSDVNLSAQIWSQAADLGYLENFIPVHNHSMLDDHTPFVRAGIPSVLLIDFDYPYWHTVEDTPDKVSALSLKAVGDTLLAWLAADVTVK